MFNLLSIFGEFGEVLELLKKKDFPSHKILIRKQTILSKFLYLYTPAMR